MASVLYSLIWDCVAYYVLCEQAKISEDEVLAEYLRFFYLFLNKFHIINTGMINSIKKYFQKAKEEVSREYSIQPSLNATGSLQSGLPVIWTGVDLDGTLAFYDRMSSPDKIGEPVPEMLALVKKMIDAKIRVKIFTARAQDPDQLPIIQKWLHDNGLPELEITNIKDYNMQRLYDDRCIQVETNTGRLIQGKTNS